MTDRPSTPFLSGGDHLLFSFFSYCDVFSKNQQNDFLASTFLGIMNRPWWERKNKNKKWRPPRTFDIFHSFEWMSRKLFCFLFAKSRAVPKAKHCAQINENLSFGGSKNNNNSPRWAHTHTLEKRNFYRTWASAKMTFYILHLLLSCFHEILYDVIQK
jgi:hypothetical protein